MKTPLIILDPGHGGHDPGAVGPTGLRESDVVLGDALMLADELAKRGLDVKTTRDEDVFLELDERAEFANARDAALFLSLHANSYSDTAAHGFEVFTSPGNTGADPLATALFDSYEMEFPDRAARKNLSDGDPDKEARFAVLIQTRMPAALFELEFISNPDGERWLADKDARRRRVRALHYGIVSYLREIDRLPATPGESPADRTGKEFSPVAETPSQNAVAQALIADGWERIAQGRDVLDEGRDKIEAGIKMLGTG